MTKEPMTPRQRAAMRKLDKLLPMSNSPAVYNHYARRQRRILWRVALAVGGALALLLLVVWLTSL